ncbi:uncharacterized protein LOC117788036 [Drosophila innubila]|uniref:uncharacterized protein LOC117788036 n=1 Tax=Drosophila innubila TaxID=198719 RepID=UPI00148E5545|nr:uncharacterized protein LOC117788036 [Drosophila innubila]
MSAILQSDLWLEFFGIYRSLPCLWKITDEVYKNKQLKKAAYEKLLVCYKKIDPQANVDTMRRRMNGIRTCFRRELRKVEMSELRAKKTSDIYVPHLWYFNELIFLRNDSSEMRADPEFVDDTSDSFFNEDDEDMDKLTEENNDFSPKEPKIEPHLEEAYQSPSSNTCRESIKFSVDQPMEHSQIMLHPDRQSRDEAFIYAEGWATSYRKLDEKNKLLAKKAIEEILVLGQLNQLEFNSVKMPQ